MRRWVMRSAVFINCRQSRVPGANVSCNCVSERRQALCKAYAVLTCGAYPRHTLICVIVAWSAEVWLERIGFYRLYLLCRFAKIKCNIFGWTHRNWLSFMRSNLLQIWTDLKGARYKSKPNWGTHYLARALVWWVKRPLIVKRKFHTSV